MPWALLAAAGLGMFAASSSGTSRAPFLLEMSRDLATSLPLVANLVAGTSIAWGIASLVSGAWSDKLGRRPFLIGGPLGVALCMVLVSLSQSFWAAAPSPASSWPRPPLACRTASAAGRWAGSWPGNP